MCPSASSLNHPAGCKPAGPRSRGIGVPGAEGGREGAQVSVCASLTAPRSPWAHPGVRDTRAPWPESCAVGGRVDRVHIVLGVVVGEDRSRPTGPGGEVASARSVIGRCAATVTRAAAAAGHPACASAASLLSHRWGRSLAAPPAVSPAPVTTSRGGRGFAARFGLSLHHSRPSRETPHVTGAARRGQGVRRRRRRTAHGRRTSAVR
jgi:hypothetical protein